MGEEWFTWMFPCMLDYTVQHTQLMSQQSSFVRTTSTGMPIIAQACSQTLQLCEKLEDHFITKNLRLIHTSCVSAEVCGAATCIKHSSCESAFSLAFSVFRSWLIGQQFKNTKKKTAEMLEFTIMLANVKGESWPVRLVSNLKIITSKLIVPDAALNYNPRFPSNKLNSKTTDLNTIWLKWLSEPRLGTGAESASFRSSCVQRITP